MRDFILSPLARQDLNDIWDHIAEDDLDAADRVREDLTDEPLRFWPVRRYLIVYRPDSDPLEIVRVLSAYRDVKKLLQ